MPHTNWTVQKRFLFMLEPRADDCLCECIHVFCVHMSMCVRCARVFGSDIGDRQRLFECRPMGWSRAWYGGCIRALPMVADDVMVAAFALGNSIRSGWKWCNSAQTELLRRSVSHHSGAFVHTCLFVRVCLSACMRSTCLDVFGHQASSLHANVRFFVFVFYFLSCRFAVDCLRFGWNNAKNGQSERGLNKMIAIWTADKYYIGTCFLLCHGKFVLESTDWNCPHDCRGHCDFCFNMAFPSEPSYEIQNVSEIAWSYILTKLANNSNNCFIKINYMHILYIATVHSNHVSNENWWTQWPV